MEDAECARLLATETAAITTLFLSYLENGDHLIATRDCYKRPREFAENVLPRLGIKTSLVEPVVAMGYWEDSAATKNRYDIEDGLVRFAGGIEDVSDVIKDLEQALECI